MSASSKQSPEYQAQRRAILDALLTLKPGKHLRFENVPDRMVKNLGITIRNLNIRGVYDESLCGNQWNVVQSQSDNFDGTMNLLFRKVVNRE